MTRFTGQFVRITLPGSRGGPRLGTTSGTFTFVTIEPDDGAAGAPVPATPTPRPPVLSAAAVVGDK